jgi:ribosomal protein S18 acetylase RimI-like enzyme
MDNVLIRALREDDAKAMNRIYSSIVKNAEKINFKRVIEKQTLSGSGISSFAAEYNGELVGFVISYVVSGGFGIDKGAWIAMIGVDPKYMGKGIGKSLAKEMFVYCKKNGIKSIYTSVRWDSTDLLSFFKALRFDRSSFINLRKILE